MEHILVVDDDPDIQELVQDYFGSYYMITLASDGVEALETFKQHAKDHPFHLVLTDVLMPNLDGIELANKLREDCPQLPIIALSGAENLDAEAIKVFNELFPKPFDFNEVYKEICGILSQF